MIDLRITNDTPEQEVQEFTELFAARNIYDDVEALQAAVAELEKPVNIVVGEVVKTREQFDGKDVYCACVDLGALPDGTAQRRLMLASIPLHSRLSG